MNTIKGTQKVWISDTKRFTPRDIKDLVDDGRTDYVIGRLSFSEHDMSRHGWAEIGTATIEVNFHKEDEVIEKLADGLRNQITIVRAEAQAKVAKLEEQLSQLLALPNKEVEV